MRRKTRRVPLSHRGFALQLGLTGRIDARCHVNAVLPWLADQGKVFEPVDGRLHWPIYTVPTLTLPGLAPEGCSIVEMFPPVDQHRTPDAWSEAHKAQVAARAMERLRRDHGIDIAVRRASSPRDFRDDLHLWEGALYGVSPLAGPAALFSHRTPIRSLYQAGQTTWPGFGVATSGLSGVFVADLLARDQRL
jgi:phytoene dehydrogenase-like protein